MLFMFHLFVVALNTYTLWYDQQYVDLPAPSEDFEKMPYKARGIFLTVWCLVLQTVYFAIALLNDIAGTNATAPKKPPLIRKIKDVVFSLAFTLAIYVSAAFWVLYVVNKDLIFPDDIESNLPSWINHVMHTLIVPFILIEMFFTNRNYPSRILGMCTMLSFCVAYVCLLIQVYLSTGIWAYPFLNIFSWPMKLLYFTSSSLLSVVFYVLGEKLDRISPYNVKIKYT